MTQPHLWRRRRGRCFSPEELRNGHQRADAAGMEYKLELWQTANGVGPFRGGGNPKALEQLLTSLTVDLRRAGGRSHILHPCLSLPHILPDLSSPPLHLPEGLGTLAAALWSKPPSGIFLYDCPGLQRDRCTSSRMPTLKPSSLG